MKTVTKQALEKLSPKKSIKCVGIPSKASGNVHSTYVTDTL